MTPYIVLLCLAIGIVIGLVMADVTRIQPLQRDLEDQQEVAKQYERAYHRELHQIRREKGRTRYYRDRVDSLHYHLGTPYRPQTVEDATDHSKKAELRSVS